MTTDSFKALLLNQAGGQIQAEFTTLARDALPEGDVLIKVAYSSLNYKDGLAVTGQGKIARQLPMVPGVDFVGVVEESASPDFQPDEWVIVTGCGAGEDHWGGYAGLARTPADWPLPLPAGLSPQQAMGIGTAGVTAMLCVLALQAHGCRPGGGEVVVTGASGGVGSLAVALLATLGYQVAASTGRTELHPYLASLGAADMIDRRELAGPPARPLQSRRWAGAIDTVGGDTLANLLTMMNDGGSAASVGLASGPGLTTTVYPFILRGVNLLGINAAHLPRSQRLELWSRLAQSLPLDLLDRIMQVEPLSDIFKLSRQILAGQVRGRIVLDVAQ